VICPSVEAKYFSRNGWTVDSALIAFAKSGFWRNVIPWSKSDEAIQSFLSIGWIASLRSQ
jgi:nuclear transport factor 2 (NTF2) superfamily protein